MTGEGIARINRALIERRMTAAGGERTTNKLDYTE